jgi:hypothetical protein
MAAGSWLLAFTAGAAVSLAASWLLVSRLERLGERAGFPEAWLGLVAALAANAAGNLEEEAAGDLHRPGQGGASRAEAGA